MRPVRRGKSPRDDDFGDYTEAKPDLVSRMGAYCSYCERPVNTNLAVEHIQPKAAQRYPTLVGRWDNFLLACVNCNSTKGSKDVVLSDTMLPDRDNTFAVYTYSADGTVRVSSLVEPPSSTVAAHTLSLVGLDKKLQEFLDENGKMVALDRLSQRMVVWLEAESIKAGLDAQPDNVLLRDFALRLALATGFFSVWMTVFSEDVGFRRRLVDGFPGTKGSGCFDPDTALKIPAPNPDALSHGGKA